MIDYTACNVFANKHKQKKYIFNRAGREILGKCELELTLT